MGRVKADRAGGTRSRTTRERAEEDQQAAISTRKTNYKTVFEEVVEEKRKLKQFILLDDEPRPTNYEFIEAGSPLVTEKCKEFSRRRGLEVYQVKRNGHLGYFFNKQVVRESRVQLGFEYGRDRHSRRPIPAQRTRTFEEQVHLDNEAYKAISELYPRMPLDNRRAIVDLAFDLHKANVGSDNLVPIRQRVDLAVVAHIRHCFTDYDSLLKADKQSDARRKARQTIEETIMAQVVEWRAPDDNSNDDGQTEAVLREFIVIDDESEEAQDDAQEIETQNQNLQSGIRCFTPFGGKKEITLTDNS
ncbi:MAG: hypothetical protein M1814_000761 [Vezdaea aestivalis]|nr:MAG: hypothetical protein M1814_000761 [Vezdaea aestivalis]